MLLTHLIMHACTYKVIAPNKIEINKLLLVFQGYIPVLQDRQSPVQMDPAGSTNPVRMDLSNKILSTARLARPDQFWLPCMHKRRVFIVRKTRKFSTPTLLLTPLYGCMTSIQVPGQRLLQQASSSCYLDGWLHCVSQQAHPGIILKSMHNLYK